MRGHATKHAQSPRENSLHCTVCARNSVEKLLFITQPHAGKQLHDIRVTGFSIDCRCRAETAQQTRDSAGGHEQGHGLAVAFAVVQVAPAVPHTVDGELCLLVAVRPFEGKRVLGDVVDFDGFAQALQRSSEEKAGDGVDCKRGRRTGYVMCVNICNTGGDDSDGELLLRRIAAKPANGAEQRRHGAHDLRDRQAAAVRKPVASHEDIGDEVFQLEVRVVSAGRRQAQLHRHHLHKAFVKSLKHNKTAARESESRGKSAGEHPSCNSHVPRPVHFHKGLHGFAEELFDFHKPFGLTYAG
jgi:hypothetical protein